jgi:hypothetical protein
MIDSQVILALYSRLLRLYPARFRTEFAEEMEQVFGLRLNEVKGNDALPGWLVVELLDLPFSIILEHWREQRQYPIQWFYSIPARENLALQREDESARCYCFVLN